MSTGFKIDFAWIPRDFGDAVERLSLAGITIEAGGVTVTEVEDSEARTTRPEIYVSAVDLASWLVANWWRLRWEADGDGLSWKMSHKVGAAGNGYLWPDVEFVSGGDTVRIRARPIRLGSTHSLRFLNEVDVHIPARNFEEGVRDFVEAVVSRVSSFGSRRADDLSGADDLSAAWRELGEAIRNPETSFGRIMEARMGLDAGEADPALLRRLHEAADSAGHGAMGELAASSGSRALADFEVLWEIVRDRSQSLSLEISPNMRSAVAQAAEENWKPWRQGVSVAALARREWSCGTGPVRTESLAELCSVPARWITDSSDEARVPIPAGFRNIEGNGVLKAALKKRHPTGRRFALARIIGDHLVAGEGEDLLPVTNADTDRQRFQRAFAREFLCPFDALRDYLGNRIPDDEFMEDAALRFDVSPVLVRNALVDHGVVGRGYLALSEVGES